MAKKIVAFHQAAGGETGEITNCLRAEVRHVRLSQFANRLDGLIPRKWLNPGFLVKHARGSEEELSFSFDGGELCSESGLNIEDEAVPDLLERSQGIDHWYLQGCCYSKQFNS